MEKTCKIFNHKNYDFLYCDWFRKLLFPLIHSPSCYRTVVTGQFVIGQFVIGQFNKPITFKVALNQPIIFKVVVKCVRARLPLCFWRPIVF